MNDFEKIEHLLLHKKYEELSSSELKEVQEYFENAIDYNDMRTTLMQVKTTLATDKVLIKPSVDLKEKLLKQFENTYTNQNTISKKRPFYRTIAFQWSAAASVVVLLSISAITYFNSLNKTDKEMAVNYKKDKSTVSPTTTDEETPNGIAETGNNGAPELEVSDGKLQDINPEEKKPVIGSNSNEQENKSRVFGNFSTTEDVINESKTYDSENAPVLDMDEKIINRDNSTLDDAKDKNGDGFKKENKLYETNTTIPVKTGNEKKNSTTKASNLSKKKKNDLTNKDNDEIQLGGYMSVNQMAQTEKSDSTRSALDSLRLDSNQMNKNSRDAKIEMDERKKDN